MPSSYLQGIQGAFDNQAMVRNDISVVAINWFVNRCPLVTRVPRVPVASQTFSMIGRSFRGRSCVLANAITASDTQFTLADAGMLMNGDVLELPSGEHVELVADPNPANGQITVRRGAESTTPVATAANATILLIGNSRTGSEVDQSAVAFKPVGILLVCAIFAFVGFELQATSFSGRIRPEGLSLQSMSMNRGSLRATIGDGSAVVVAQTFSGDVVISRK